MFAHFGFSKGDALPSGYTVVIKSVTGGTSGSPKHGSCHRQT